MHARSNERIHECMNIDTNKHIHIAALRSFKFKACTQFFVFAEKPRKTTDVANDSRNMPEVTVEQLNSQDGSAWNCSNG